MHPLRCAEDRVDRAGVDAERATDATRLVDDRYGQRRMDAATGVERLWRTARDRRERHDRRRAAGRAAVDVGFAARNRLRVRPAGVVAAARALRLGQRGIETFDEYSVHTRIVASKPRDTLLTSDAPTDGEKQRPRRCGAEGVQCAR